MGAFGAMFLLGGLFFLYKAFTAPNLIGRGRGIGIGRRRRISLFGEDAGKIDCGLFAAVMLFGAFEIFWNM